MRLHFCGGASCRALAGRGGNSAGLRCDAPAFLRGCAEMRLHFCGGAPCRVLAGRGGISLGLRCDVAALLWGRAVSCAGGPWLHSGARVWPEIAWRCFPGWLGRESAEPKAQPSALKYVCGGWGVQRLKEALRSVHFVRTSKMCEGVRSARPNLCLSINKALLSDCSWPWKLCQNLAA